MTATPSPAGLGCVVNFYLGQGSANHVRDILVATTSLGIRFLTLSEAVDTVMVVDGSPEPCASMREACATLGVRYHHDGRELSYVEAYNIGVDLLPHAYIALMANDILPNDPAVLDRLFEWIQRPGIGCVFPYMATNRVEWDEVQRPSLIHRGVLTCEPASMTLNLNLFKRSVLEEIGGLDENYLFGYQEPILLIKIRSLGYRAVMVGRTCVFHLDRLTKALEASSLTRRHQEADARRWFEEYPHHASPRGIANIKLWSRPFATTWRSRIAWWLAYLVPFRWLRSRACEYVIWMEPVLCRYPARGHGRRL